MAVEPLLREYLGAEPEPGLTPAQLFDTAIAGSDAWSHISARLREAWQAKRMSSEEIWRLAKICRVANVMRPYLESIA